MELTASTLEVMRQRIDRLRQRKGLSPRALSLAIGANHSYIAQLLSGKGGAPSATKLTQLAEALDTNVDYLTGTTDNPGPINSEVGVGDRLPPFRHFPREEPMIPLVGTGDCADLEVCNESGQMVDVQRSSFDPDFHVRYIARPPALAGARDLYAIYFHGTSMSPRFEPGEVGIVDPRRPAAPGDYVLVQLFDEADRPATDGDPVGDRFVTSVLVKRLVRQSAKEVALEQLNPPLVFTVPRDQVARVHRIMPQTELLF